MLKACRMVMIMVKTTGPNSSMVAKMKSCPIDEQMDVATACAANDSCRCMKSTHSSRLPLKASDVNVRIVEKRLTKNIMSRNEMGY